VRKGEKIESVKIQKIKQKSHTNIQNSAINLLKQYESIKVPRINFQKLFPEQYSANNGKKTIKTSFLNEIRPSFSSVRFQTDLARFKTQKNKQSEIKKEEKDFLDKSIEIEPLCDFQKNDIDFVDESLLGNSEFIPIPLTERLYEKNSKISTIKNSRLNPSDIRQVFKTNINKSYKKSLILKPDQSLKNKFTSHNPSENKTNSPIKEEILKESVVISEFDTDSKYSDSTQSGSSGNIKKLGSAKKLKNLLIRRLKGLRNSEEIENEKIAKSINVTFGPRKEIQL